MLTTLTLLFLPSLTAVAPIFLPTVAAEPWIALQQEEAPAQEDTPNNEQEADEEDKPPTPEEAIAALEAAKKSKSPIELAFALEEFGSIDDKAVVKFVGKYLKDKDDGIRLEAIKALRWNPHANATKELVKQKKNKKIIENKECGTEYIYALGTKGGSKCLSILKDGLRYTATEGIKQRIQALGNIRDIDSVEALMSLMTSGKGRRDSAPNMNTLRVSLMVLTGEDLGRKSIDWIQWWNKNRKSLKISADPWPLDKRVQRQWDMLWASPKEKEEARAKAKDKRDGGDGGDDSDSDEF